MTMLGPRFEPLVLEAPITTLEGRELLVEKAVQLASLVISLRGWLSMLRHSGSADDTVKPR